MMPFPWVNTPDLSGIVDSRYMYGGKLLFELITMIKLFHIIFWRYRSSKDKSSSDGLLPGLFLKTNKEEPFSITH